MRLNWKRKVFNEYLKKKVFLNNIQKNPKLYKKISILHSCTFSQILQTGSELILPFVKIARRTSLRFVHLLIRLSSPRLLHFGVPGWQPLSGTWGGQILHIIVHWLICVARFLMFLVSHLMITLSVQFVSWLIMLNPLTVRCILLDLSGLISFLQKA